MTAVSYKTCDLCKQTTNTGFDTLLFGNWQQTRGVCVHYFCLLLSTNLPQLGKDNAGINGFLLRDIRQEIATSAKRSCCFCGKMHASIACHKCKEYFHLVCGRNNLCLFQFHNDFRSYCNECLPTEVLLPAGFQQPSSVERCSICSEQLGKFKLVKVIFGVCCGRGYAHSVCLQKYAMCAGYYLKCLWCRSTSFRNDVRLRGIFVPDRDAQWELEKGAYRDLHRGHSRCDMDKCFCPKGRDFVSGKWQLAICLLCGSVGAHNPTCIPGTEKSKERVTNFKCYLCAQAEAKAGNKCNPRKHNSENTQIDFSVYMVKKAGSPPLPAAKVEHVETLMGESPTFSGYDSETSSENTANTVLQCSAYAKGAVPKGCAPVTYPQNEIKKQLQVTEHEIRTPETRNDENVNDNTNLVDSVAEFVGNVALSERNNIPLTTTIQETLCIQSTQANDVVTQSPAVSSTSQDLDNDHFVTFDVFEFDRTTNTCLGARTVRINLMEPRFAGKTLDIIQKTPGLLKASDVIARRDDLGIFSKINHIINKYI